MQNKQTLKPCRRQAKQTNAQALQPSSKTNAREYATAKFKALATTVWKRCIFCKSSRRCRRQYTTKISRIPPRHAIFLQLLACLARHPSTFTSWYGTDTAGRGAFEPPPKTALHRSYLTENSSSANRILRPRRKKFLTESTKKRMIIYI